MFDLLHYLGKQITWSQETFGPGCADKGLIAHIKKELKEIENAPGDIMEWIDVVILGFDGALRNGHSPETVISCLNLKQEINFDREWPDWREADPDKAIEHIKPEEERQYAHKHPLDPWKHRSKGMRCKTCMWFVPKQQDPGKLTLGRCRRSAPTMDGYPVVYPSDWCGDHKLDEGKL